MEMSMMSEGSRDAGAVKLDDDNVYFSAAQAAKVLVERQNLWPRVEAWWLENGWGRPPIPELTQTGKMAVLARHAATARYEDVAYYELAKRAGLFPAWLTYTADAFVDKSPFKLGLIAPYLCSGRGRNGGLKLTKMVLTKAIYCFKKPICEIRTTDGRLVVEIHQEMHRALFPDGVIFDLSDWLFQFGCAKDYYTAFLSIFLAHGVLFEDFHQGESGDGLGKFTQGVFEPSWREVCEIFGIKPLLVRLPWLPEFAHYPADPAWQDHGIIPPEILE